MSELLLPTTLQPLEDYPSVSGRPVSDGSIAGAGRTEMYPAHFPDTQWVWHSAPIGAPRGYLVYCGPGAVSNRYYI